MSLIPKVHRKTYIRPTISSLHVQGLPIRLRDAFPPVSETPSITDYNASAVHVARAVRLWEDAERLAKDMGPIYKLEVFL